LTNYDFKMESMKRLVIVLLVMLFVLGMVTFGFAQVPAQDSQGTSYKLAPAKGIISGEESTFQLGIVAMPTQGYVKTMGGEYTVNTNGWLQMRVRGSFALPNDPRNSQLWLQSGFGLRLRSGNEALKRVQGDGSPMLWVTNWNLMWLDLRGYQTPMCLSIEGKTHKMWENSHGSMAVRLEVYCYWWNGYNDEGQQTSGPLNPGLRIVLSHLGK
jgi:hypothetical protein